MSGDSQDDFRLQLELEEREKEKKEYESSHCYTDPNDGTVYIWDLEKKAWFPKIDDDFIAAYQANYGFTDAGSASTTDTSKTGDTSTADSASKSTDEQTNSQAQKPAWQKKLEKRKAEEAQPAGWFDVEEQHNTNVYVSDLPLDITDEEFSELMSKCGIIMKDPVTQELKIKLYRDETGKLKGDGRCCYIKVESVTMALQIIDGSLLRGKTIKVERAQFTMKGNYDPSKKPKKKRNHDKKKLKKMHEKIFDWRPDRPAGTRLRWEKTVIIKNMFDPKEFEASPELILEYNNDLREECARFGSVKKVTVYDRNPEGIASITFEEAEEADACIEAMNNRWFSKRQLQAACWDGKEKYHIEETSTETEHRIKDWEKYLEEGEKSETGDKSSTSKAEEDVATTT